MSRWLWLSLCGLALAWFALLALPGCGDTSCDHDSCCETTCSGGHCETHCDYDHY